MLTDFSISWICVNKMRDPPFVLRTEEGVLLTDTTDFKKSVNFVNIFCKKVDRFDKK